MIDAATGYKPEDVAKTIRLKCPKCDQVASMARPDFIAKSVACVVMACPEHTGADAGEITFENEAGERVTEKGDRIKPE